MKTKLILAQSVKETAILKMIEENRVRIHDRIVLDDNIAFDDETVKMSQNLDKLIVEYMSFLEGRIREKG